MSLVVIDRDKKFHNFKLFPFIPHHKQFIERALAGMAIVEGEGGQNAYKGFKKYYLSFGVPLLGIDEAPTFENARDEEKILAGWVRNTEGALVAKLEAPKVEKPKVEEPKKKK